MQKLFLFSTSSTDSHLSQKIIQIIRDWNGFGAVASGQ